MWRCWTLPYFQQQRIYSMSFKTSLLFNMLNLVYFGVLKTIKIKLKKLKKIYFHKLKKNGENLKTWKWNVCLVVVYNIINVCMSGLNLRSKPVCHRAAFALIQKSFQISIVQMIIVKGSYAYGTLEQMLYSHLVAKCPQKHAFLRGSSHAVCGVCHLLRYICTNSCVGLSLKIASFFCK